MAEQVCALCGAPWTKDLDIIRINGNLLVCLACASKNESAGVKHDAPYELHDTWLLHCPQCATACKSDVADGPYHCTSCGFSFQYNIDGIRAFHLGVPQKVCGVPNTAEGVKHDDGKLLWSLLPLRPVQEIVKVLMRGAKKYAPENWKHVPDARTRYFNATMRHITAWKMGEPLDAEWGLHHLAHAGCCILFLLWFELEKPDAK